MALHPAMESGGSLGNERAVAIASGDELVAASFAAPPFARACAIVANDHRHAPWVRECTRQLQAAGFATLVLDLRPESLAGMARQVSAARKWDARNVGLQTVLAGVGDAALAVLISAAVRPDNVAAVVTFGRVSDVLVG